MKYIQYDANQLNMDRMLQVQRQKINHLKMLNTIYTKKQFALLKDQKQIDKQRQLRLNNKILDKQRKWKESQSQINHQNKILRNKLLQIYVPKQKQFNLNDSRNSHTTIESTSKRKQFNLNFPSLSQPKQSRTNLHTHSSIPSVNYKKINQQKQLIQTNIKFFDRLSSMKSDLSPKLKLRQHSKDMQYFKQMISKRSPKRQNRMKKFIEKNMSERIKFALPSPKNIKEISFPNINPQQPFVFY